MKKYKALRMTTAIATISRKNIFERILLYHLRKMKKGKMTLVLPSGEELILGEEPGSDGAQMTINHTDFFRYCILYGDIGFGEAYVDGLWDSQDPCKVVSWFILNIEHLPGASGSRSRSGFINLLKFLNRFSHFLKINNLKGSRKNIRAYYDLSNSFFSLFLDPSMTYSSAYFENDDLSLEEAQLAKYERLCRKLKLGKEDHVLEIGSGWGANAIYMARQYGCRVTSLTISNEQHHYAVERVKAEGLEDRVSILLMDYREMSGQFDKIVSVEMLEAVGDKYYNAYFKKCNELLKPSGILALQVITCPDSRYRELRDGVDWIQKYIFPGSLLPSVGVINKAVNEVSELSLVDLKDLGLDYAKTLQLWGKAFTEKIPEIRKIGFDERFVRMWQYYFNYCRAAFESRNIHVMQMVYTRPNNVER